MESNLQKRAKEIGWWLGQTVILVIAILFMKWSGISGRPVTKEDVFLVLAIMTISALVSNFEKKFGEFNPIKFFKRKEKRVDEFKDIWASLERKE